MRRQRSRRQGFGSQVSRFDSLNPAKLGREINDLQNVLLKLAKDKTDQLYLASVPTELPDVRRGIRVHAS